jgi:Holliday junction resolvasome RuvABC endonuclease subunit
MPIKPSSEEKDPEKYLSVLGVDSSSLGVAWTHLLNGNMHMCGKINLSKKKELRDKLKLVYEEWTKLLDLLQPDYIIIEQSIFVKNPATARTLSQVVGSLMCIAAGKGYEVELTEPGQWKSWLGYKNLSSKFVKHTKEILGDREGAKFCEKLRKSQTWRVIEHNYSGDFSLPREDNDVADSWGIALYGYNKKGADVELEISNEIRYDLEEFARLGITLP